MASKMKMPDPTIGGTPRSPESEEEKVVEATIAHLRVIEARAREVAENAATAIAVLQKPHGLESNAATARRSL
jgi:hypothetical protein